jgi:hypothetical protein
VKLLKSVEYLFGPTRLLQVTAKRYVTERVSIMKKILVIIVICSFFVGAHGLCQAVSKPMGLGWKGQPFKGSFTTKDGRMQQVDDFLNLSEYHVFHYRYDGFVMPMSIVVVKSLTALEGNRVRVTQKNGEVLTVDMWDAEKHRCMLFTIFQAEITRYVRRLVYVYYDESQGKDVQAEVMMCDLARIEFE